MWARLAITLGRTCIALGPWLAITLGRTCIALGPWLAITLGRTCIALGPWLTRVLRPLLLLRTLACTLRSLPRALWLVWRVFGTRRPILGRGITSF